jgi:hypothetical protein
MTDQGAEFLCHLEEDVSTCFHVYTYCPVVNPLVLIDVLFRSLWCCRYQSSLGNKRIELFDAGNDHVAEDNVQMASGGTDCHKVVLLLFCACKG